MDNRPFPVRFACAASGVMLIVLGSLVVPASGIACLFLFDESASGNPYVDDDATLGAFVFSCVIALAYGVFAAPSLWRNRPFRPTEKPSPSPMAERWQNPMFPYDVAPWGSERYGAPGHFWELRQPPAPAQVMRAAQPIVPVPQDPIIEVGRPAEVNLAEIEALERAQEAEVRRPAFVEESVPTVIGMPAAIAIQPDEPVCRDEDWFT